MPLDVHIIDSVTGEVDPEFAVQIGAEVHEMLFAHPRLRAGSFPLLARLGDYYSDAEYAHGELEVLIAEIELAAMLFEADSRVRRVLGPFHSLCCVAWARDSKVVLYAD